MLRTSNNLCHCLQDVSHATTEIWLLSNVQSQRGAMLYLSIYTECIITQMITKHFLITYQNQQNDFLNLIFWNYRRQLGICLNHSSLYICEGEKKSINLFPCSLNEKKSFDLYSLVPLILDIDYKLHLLIFSVENTRL